MAYESDDKGLQDMLLEEWFYDPPICRQQADPLGEWKREMRIRRENPFTAEWVGKPGGKRYLMINMPEPEYMAKGLQGYWSALAFAVRCKIGWTIERMTEHLEIQHKFYIELEGGGATPSSRIKKLLRKLALENNVEV